MFILKKYLKDFINIFSIVVLFSISNITNLFAVADYAINTTYKVTKDGDGTNRFKSSLPILKPGLFFEYCLDDQTDNSNFLQKGLCYVSGDFAFELGNPFCSGYTILYNTAMYFGNSTVKKIATATLLGVVAVVWSTAIIKNEDIEICGADWLVWGTNEDADPSALTNIKEYYPALGAFAGSRKFEVAKCARDFNKCVEHCKNYEKCQKIENVLDNLECTEKNPTPCMLDLDFIEKDGARTYLTINDRVYRERFYDGEEIKNDKCVDPREEAKKYDVNQSLKTPYQLYYMRGTDPANYACDRFLVDKVENGDKFDEAYKCCVKTSNSLCIIDKRGFGSDRVRFCSIESSTCTMDELIFNIFPSEKEEPGKYCAKTFSFCPYNFNLQRGTEKASYFKKVFKDKEVDEKIDPDCIENCKTTKITKSLIEDECYDYANDKPISCQGKIKNFYQYNRHCTFVNGWVPKPVDDIAYPPFIDKACINFVGSSHNTEGYKKYTGYNKMFDLYKSFSAPIAECLSETLKNFLFNRAGHTKCSGNDKILVEIPDMNGICKTGYDYIEGQDLKISKGIEVPAVKLLSYIHSLIMLAVLIMISLYGYNILINSGKIDRTDIMIRLIKLVIVVTFSASGWWYDQMYKFTYGFSNTFSSMTSKLGFDDTVDVKGNYIKFDGCYFGDINNILGKEPGTSVANIENNYHLYPANKKYISFFDALDCKINKYLGYGVGLNVPNLLIFLAVSLMWPFSMGIYLGVATFLLALFIINFVIKAVYIFVVSAMALAIMLYLAPLIIPCILFKRTKGIFDGWLKNLISFALQPMVLFAYVSLAITIMDKYTLGEGIFTGTGLNRELVCGYSCVDENTNIIDYISGTSSSQVQEFTNLCTSSNQNNKVLDLRRNSFLCYLSNITTAPVSGLNSLGIIFRSLTDIRLSDAIMFLRVAFLFFILTKVLETVPGIAANLTGGKKLPGTDFGDPFVMARNIKDISDTIVRGTRNLGTRIRNALPSVPEDSKDSSTSTPASRPLNNGLTGASVSKQKNDDSDLTDVNVGKQENGEKNE